MFPPPVTGDQNTLMGFLRGDKETEEGVQKGGTGIEELLMLLHCDLLLLVL